jgi:hypothetical protein
MSDTCTYGCQITEYTYWGLTSILGAQNFTGREEAINHEWKLNTLEKVEADDPTLYSLLTNETYGFPTDLPNGTYEGSTLKVEKVAPFSGTFVPETTTYSCKAPSSEPDTDLSSCIDYSGAAKSSIETNCHSSAGTLEKQACDLASGTNGCKITKTTGTLTLWFSGKDWTSDFKKPMCDAFKGELITN